MQNPFHELAPALDGQSLRVLIWDRDLTDLWCLDRDGRRQPYRGKGSLWHVHPEVELTLITAGEGMLYVGDHIGRFSAPDCLLLGGHLPHVWKSSGAMAGISVQFRPDAAGLAALPELAQLDTLWTRARHGLRWRGATAANLRALLARLDARPSLARLGLFLEVLDALRRAPANDARRLSRERLFVDDDDRPSEAMHRVLDHLMEHHREEIRLATLVRLSGRSQATFCRQFARLTGKTFSAYLNAIRLQEVRRALLESEREVTDIALGAGFASLTNFYAQFRRAERCTPREFRRRGRAATG